jgi:hypothetical protein
MREKIRAERRTQVFDLVPEDPRDVLMLHALMKIDEGNRLIQEAIELLQQLDDERAH